MTVNLLVCRQEDKDKKILRSLRTGCVRFYTSSLCLCCEKVFARPTLAVKKWLRIFVKIWNCTVANENIATKYASVWQYIVSCLISKSLKDKLYTLLRSKAFVSVLNTLADHIQDWKFWVIHWQNSSVFLGNWTCTLITLPRLSVHLQQGYQGRSFFTVTPVHSENLVALPKKSGEEGYS